MPLGVRVPVRGSPSLEIRQCQTVVGSRRTLLYRLIDALEGILIPFTVREEIGLRPIIQGRTGQHTALQHVFARNRMGTADDIIGQVLRHLLTVTQHKGSGSGGNLQTARRSYAVP